MKRFFQPVPKDGSPAKKRRTGATDSGNAPAAAGAGGEEGSPGEEPRKFLTWNANSLLLRMKSDWPAFSQFVARLDPDVICIQVSDLGFRFGGSSFVCGLICNAARSSERSVCGGLYVCCNVGNPKAVDSGSHYVEQVGAMPVRFGAPSFRWRLV